jgi:hypothetical protein
VTAQIRIVKSIKTFAKTGQATQRPTTHLANPLSFTSTRSMKLAKDKRHSSDHPQPQQDDKPTGTWPWHGYNTPAHNQKTPDDAEDHLKLGPTAIALLLVAVVVLEAVAGLTLFEAPPVLSCPSDH